MASSSVSKASLGEEDAPLPRAITLEAATKALQVNRRRGADLVNRILDAGGTIGLANPPGTPLLCVAAMHAHTELVRLLLARDAASVDAVDTHLSLIHI